MIRFFADLLFFYAGMLTFSFVTLQSFITLFCSIPTTKKLIENNVSIDKKIYKRFTITIFMSLLLTVLIFSIPFFIKYNAGTAGFIIGFAVSFFASLGKMGETPDNLNDYKNSYRKYLNNDSEGGKNMYSNIEYCRKCGSPIDQITKKCPQCGKQYLSKSKIYMYAISFMCIVLLFTTIYFYKEYSSSYKIAQKTMQIYDNLNNEFVERFGSYKNPSTGEYINGAQDYIDAMDAQEGYSSVD